MMNKKDHEQMKQVDGIIGLKTRQITSRLPFPAQFVLVAVLPLKSP